MAIIACYTILLRFLIWKKKTEKKMWRTSFFIHPRQGPIWFKDKIVNYFVDLKSNLALLYNKGHNFWKSLSTWKIPQNWIFPNYENDITFKKYL